VAQVAGERQLGACISASKGSNPFSNFAFALAVTVAIFGAVVAVGSLGIGVLRPILVLGLALSLLWLFFAVVSLFTGFRRFYLFAGGVVRWQNGRVRAVSWSEVTTVTRSRFGTTRSGYELHLAGGRKLVVEAVESTDTGREFGRQIEEAAAHAGMQVIG
jgi:hypothetical protein